MIVKLNGVTHEIKLDHLEQSTILAVLWDAACKAKTDRRRIVLDRAHLILAALFAVECGEKGAELLIDGRE